jgi:hypothetical protein
MKKLNTINDILESKLSDKQKVYMISKLANCDPRLGNFNPETQKITRIWSLEDIRTQITNLEYLQPDDIVVEDIFIGCIEKLSDITEREWNIIENEILYNDIMSKLRVINNKEN